jgi:hypothetical protein
MDFPVFLGAVRVNLRHLAFDPCSKLRHIMQL